MATIKDVAREAKVAISTVSNVLNNVDVVKPDTKEKVLEVIKKLNYTPNLNGRYLKKTQTKILGLFITNLEGFFYNGLISAMYAQCCASNYNLTIFLNNENNFTDSYETIMGKRVDGAIILNSTIQKKHVDMFEKMEIPMVFLDREVVSKNITSVVIDNYAGMEKIIEYLMQEGYTKIGYIHGIFENYDEIMRYKGYADTLKKYGISLDKKYELKGNFAEKDTYREVCRYIEEGKELPEVLVAANDEMAIGCIEALNKKGFCVPKDIRVIGFDNIEKTSYFTPKITTIDSSIKELGTVAVDKLLQIINEQTNDGIRKIPCNLVIRDS